MPLSIHPGLSSIEGNMSEKGAPLRATAQTAPAVAKDSDTLGQELKWLRTQIKREAEAYQRHTLLSGYEDLRPRPLSTGQRIKDFLVGVQMAGSGHKPGHVPNRAMQQASKSRERLRRLNDRYIPLARAEALALMSEQLMDAESALSNLSPDKAAVVNIQVDRLRARFEAAKFAFAINVGEAFAQRTTPLLPLLNLNTYVGLHSAGQRVFDAADAARGWYQGQYASEGGAAHSPPDQSGLATFTSQIQSVLTRIDAALSLPGADGADLEEVKVLLRNLGASAAPSTAAGYGMAEGVYHETTTAHEAQGYSDALARLAGDLSGWLLGSGVLLTQRVGQFVEQNPVRALAAFGVYAAVSAFYTHWFLPPSPALEEPAVADNAKPLDVLLADVLGEPVPKHPDALIGKVLEDAVDSIESRSKRTAQPGNGPMTVKIRAALATSVDGGNQTLSSLIRQQAGIDARVDDHALARAVEPGLSQFKLKETKQQAEFARHLSARLDEVLNQVVDWLNSLSAPILDPSAVVDDIILQRARDYANQTAAPITLTPGSRLRVDYQEAQSADANLHITASVTKTKYYSLKEVVTGTYLNDVRLMRDSFGRSFKVVHVEQQALVDFIGKGAIKDQLEAELSAYKARPGIREKSVSYYETRVTNAGLNYLDSTPITHPGHTLMADFLNGDLKASSVEFHGATVNGVFAVTQGDRAVLCSVDDDACFYIEEKVNHYWKFGGKCQEVMPVYPTDPGFKQWVLMKLPIIDKLKASRNPNAFDVTKTMFSTNAQIGMGRNGGRVNIKPLSFEHHDTLRSLGERFFDGNMARVESDIDSLIFTDWERYGLEALGVMKAMLNTAGFLAMFMAPGTGTFLAKAAVAGVQAGISLTSAGVSALQGVITDDPTERDAVNRQALLSLSAAGALQLGLPAAIHMIMAARRAAITMNVMASELGYYRFAKAYIQSQMPRVVVEVAAKRMGLKVATGAAAPRGQMALVAPAQASAAGNGAKPPAPWPGSANVAPIVPGPVIAWGKMTDAERITQLTQKMATSKVAGKLIGQTSQRAVSQSIANNLRLDTTGGAKSHFDWRSERAETNVVRSKLNVESQRLDEVDRFMRELRTNPPLLESRVISGPAEHNAASWVVTSSSVKVPEGRVRQLIETFRQATLTDMKVVDEIHQSLSGAADGFRPTGTGNLLGSDIARGAFEKSLVNLDVPAGLSRAQWLFALTASLQPFAKNNDPLARVLYALGELQDANNNGFKVLGKTAELRLSPYKPATTKTTLNTSPARAENIVADTRVEPFRQIEVDPSREIPAEMRDFMTRLRSDVKLEKAFIAPAGECAKTSEIVAQFMQVNGFENIKFRAMLIWSSRNPDGVFNHFLPVGDFKGETYAFDLTAPQFANKGMPSLTEPMILPEPALMRAYQLATNKALIKYKDFPSLRSAETAFSAFSTPLPNQYIEGGHILSYGWSKPSVVEPSVSLAVPKQPARQIARVTVNDLPKPVRDLGVPFERSMIGPETWRALSDQEKIDYLVTRLLVSEDGKALIEATSKDTVVKTIRENLERDGVGVPRQRYAWGGLQVEIQHGLRRLHSDLARLGKINTDMKVLLSTAPVVEREIMLGNQQAMAAKWIVGASRSDGLSESEVQAVLHRNRNADLTDIQQIDRIHREVYKPAPGEQYRDFRSSSDPVFTSQPVGHAAFAKQLPLIAQSARDGKLPLAEGLFAGAVRYHPYGDGNGRLSRTLYALAQFREQGTVFEALTPAGENTLNPRD